MNGTTANSSALTPEAMTRILHETVDQAQAVVLGAGAGLSTAAGIEYTGARFRSLFGDFIERYGLTDMYSAGFYPFATPEERWAYWSRHILANRYAWGPLPVYQRLRELLTGTEHFVVTTNVDHAFATADFGTDTLFATQGDYGLFQCSVPCRQQTWNNEQAVREMAATQSDCRIPSRLAPRCPWCGKPATTYLRVDERFVQDDHWYRSARRYQDFLGRHETGQVLYLEIGVGWNTPGIIKYPFWQRTAANPSSTYLVINPQPVIPEEIERRTVALPVSFRELLLQ